MKERLQELMNQTGVPTSIPFDQWCEKFAELIVKECVKCCEEIADINKTYKEVDLVDPEFGPKECIETIKKHFGVEE